MNQDILKIGRVVEVSGARIVGRLEGTVEDLYRTYRSRRYAVGQVGSIVKIEAGEKLVFGVVTALRMTETPPDERASASAAQGASSDAKWLEVDLFGEALQTSPKEADFDFQRGVSTYPLPGQDIFVASVDELNRIYRRPNKPSIHVGTLSQASSLPVHLLMDDLLGKHFAVLGTTGAGKSCSVAVLLGAILKESPNAHVVLLDPHDEYRCAFPDNANVIDPTTLNLPHWLLNFEESVALFVGRTERSATSQTNILKEALLDARKNFGLADGQVDEITVDTPVPYTMGKLIRSIEAAMPSQKSQEAPYKKILDKIEILQRDKRFAFLVRSDDDVTDDFGTILSEYLRIPVSGKPLSIIDLSGVPSDVVDVVVSVLCRMIFDFAVWGSRPVKAPVLLVCEEAHRYAPQGEESAFQPTRQALSRIAKEGRKYGVGLGLISQRPSELSESILSQCNTLIALRMSNDRDQNFVRRALPDSVRSLVESLSVLRTQEALVVGEGTVVPVRMRFDDLSEDRRPQSSDVPFAELWSDDSADTGYVREVIRRWRSQKRPRTSDSDD